MAAKDGVLNTVRRILVTLVVSEPNFFRLSICVLLFLMV